MWWRWAFLFLPVILCLSTDGTAAVLLDRVMAVVNKDVITWSEVYKNMEFEAADAVRGMKDDERRRFFKENEAAFLERMIDVKLLLQEAGRLGMGASEDDVRKAIEGMKKKHGMDDVQFRETIAKEGFTTEGYKKKLAEQIAIGRVIEQEVRSKVLVTEGEVDTYLAEHPDLQRQSEGFSLSRIYLKNRDDRATTEERARNIYSRIRSGDDFGLLARQFSEDATAKSGGDCGFLKKTEISPDFLPLLASMKPGDVSEPVWTDSGVYILRLDGVQEIKSEKDLREKVRQRLSEERFAKEYKDWVKVLRERSYINIKT
jgi:peptidyl-prolyl cis-trans isomerase SurA